MERSEINAGTFDWDTLLRHVTGDQVTVEVTKNEVPIAQIGPVKRPVSMSKLSSVLASLPSLGTDVESFGTDIESVLGELPTEGDPWAS